MTTARLTDLITDSTSFTTSLPAPRIAEIIRGKLLAAGIDISQLAAAIDAAAADLHESHEAVIATWIDYAAKQNTARIKAEAAERNAKAEGERRTTEAWAVVEEEREKLANCQHTRFSVLEPRIAELNHRKGE